jgi:hypothetical protein
MTRKGSLGTGGGDGKFMAKTVEPLFSLEAWWEKFVEKTPVKYISLILCLIGGGLLYWSPIVSFRHSLGEAAVIAGLLVFLVDPFLKARLLREAAQDIFQYILGFDQPPEIKDRLSKIIFNTKLFRRNFELKCRLLPESASMRLEIEYSCDVINPTHEAIAYCQAIQAERVENPQVHLMTLISAQENYSISPELQNKSDDPVVLEAKAPEIKLAPNMTYRFGCQYSLTYPRQFFYALHFGMPTIGVTIEIFSPDGFEVTASQTSIHAANLWRYDDLFMPGDHVDIRWQQRSI